MKHTALFALLALFTLFFSGTLRAEPKVIVDRNVDRQASPDFKFSRVPVPSKTDLGNKARVSVVAGRPDPNGAGVECLNDGLLSQGDDDPSASFFFAQGSRGGRLLFDLGAATSILRVNTYSWHANTRGPQVYTLYAADGAAPGFNPKPDASAALAQSGWKKIAVVDTRPKDGEPGGQYGVSIANADDAALGSFRYLLFEISRTEDVDPFGNTFFSEIDIHDGKTYPAPQLAAGKYEIVIDYSEMPELKDWVETKLRPALEKWYPVIVEMLPSPNYTAPRRFTVTFEKNGRGVAATGGTHVSCAGPWFKQNLEGEAVGAVVHELVHVAQQYRGRRGNPNPGWLVEGVADYIRWFKYEPERLRPRPNPARAKYTDSYRVTAAFLNYVTENHDKEIVRKLNAAMRQGQYSPDLWKQYTGKTIDELWADYMKTLQQPSK